MFFDGSDDDDIKASLSLYDNDCALKTTSSSTELCTCFNKVGRTLSPGMARERKTDRSLRRGTFVIRRLSSDLFHELGLGMLHR